MFTINQLWIFKLDLLMRASQISPIIIFSSFYSYWFIYEILSIQNLKTNRNFSSCLMRYKLIPQPQGSKCQFQFSIIVHYIFGYLKDPSSCGWYNYLCLRLKLQFPHSCLFHGKMEMLKMMHRLESNSFVSISEQSYSHLGNAHFAGASNVC